MDTALSKLPTAITRQRKMRRLEPSTLHTMLQTILRSMRLCAMRVHIASWSANRNAHRSAILDMSLDELLAMQDAQWAQRGAVRCDIFGCESTFMETQCFENSQITCLECGKKMCPSCTAQIWSGEWSGTQFYKPKFVLPGMLHEVFCCPFCRATFDQVRPVA